MKRTAETKLPARLNPRPKRREELRLQVY